MSFYKYVKKVWDRPKDNPAYRERLIKWRKQSSIEKIEKPTRIDRARALGYKAKKGIVMARVKVDRGGRIREQIKKGRRSKTSRRRKIVGKSYKVIAEERAQRKFKNLEVLNSYEVAKDGKYYFFEVILVNPYAPEIKSDKNLNWICARKHTNRVLRGKTSAGKASRGLRNKGKGAEKARPSRRANKRLNK